MCVNIAAVLGALAVLASTPASAAISGFQLNSLEGVGDMEQKIHDRLKEELKISYQDCIDYIGFGTSQHADTVEETTVVEEPTTVDHGSNEELTESPADDPWRSAEEGKADDAGDPDARVLLTWSVSSVFNGYDYAIKIGSCSDTGSLTDEESAGCTYLVSRTDLTSFTNNELFIDVLDLIPDGCQAGDSGETGVYFFLQLGEDTFTKQVEVVKFQFDFDPPAPPENVTLDAGEENIQVAWDDEKNSETVEYVVYWYDDEFGEGDLDQVDSKSGLSAKEYQITGLELGTTYWVAVATEDDYGNLSDLSEVLSAIPVSVDDFWEYYNKSGGQEEGGFCFVATAAYGTRMAPSVQLLQRFRDHVLLGNSWGRTLTDWYYVHGPDAAAVIRHSPALRFVARVALAPAVGAAWLVLDATWYQRAALVAAAVGLLVGWRALRRRAVRARSDEGVDSGAPGPFPAPGVQVAGNSDERRSA